MEQDPHATRRYLDELSRLLGGLPAGEREEAVREIGSHIAEARRAGTPLAAVLARLGEPALLARAYESDFLLQQPLPAEVDPLPADSTTGRVVRIVGPVLDLQFQA